MSIFGQSTRPYCMGFTTWPPDDTPDAVAQMGLFIANHGDIVGIQLDSGLPWAEALSGAEFPAKVNTDWSVAKNLIPPGHRVYLALMPLDLQRENLAPFWDAAPLTPPWDGYAFNAPDVKTAFTNYAIRAIQYFQPDYLNLCLETNILLTKRPEAWVNEFTGLYIHTRAAVNAAFPSLPVFTSWSLDHIKGYFGANPTVQGNALWWMLHYADLLGLSVYPYRLGVEPEQPTPADFFDIVLQYQKPIAITETGAPSKPFSCFGIDYGVNEEYQRQYLELLLNTGKERGFEFIINWASTDYDKLYAKYPELLGELGKFWMYTGLQDGDYQAKPALKEWQRFLRMHRI